jgi:hypothetical protein
MSESESQFQKFLEEDLIEEVVFEMVNENPSNHGKGFRTYKITPYWKPDMAPEGFSDFYFETDIYWSPFETEYFDQLDHYTHGAAYAFIGYDHDEEVKKFEIDCKKVYDEEISPISGDE